MKKAVRIKGVKLGKAAKRLRAGQFSKLSSGARQRVLLRKALGDFLRETGLGRLEGADKILEFADKDTKKAMSSMTATGLLGLKGAIRPLALVLKIDADGLKRFTAVKALGNIDDVRAVKPLLEAKDKDTDPEVRLAAALALGEHFAEHLVGENPKEKAKLKVAERKLDDLGNRKRNLLLYLIASNPEVRRQLPASLNARDERMAYLLNLKKDALEKDAVDLFHDIEVMEARQRKRLKQKAKPKKKGKK